MHMLHSYIVPVQNPVPVQSSNQPTQCHEARRGKCRKGGTTGTMTVAYAYAVYACVNVNVSYKNEKLKKRYPYAVYTFRCWHNRFTLKELLSNPNIVYEMM